MTVYLPEQLNDYVPRLKERFADEADARELATHLRFPRGIFCPECFSRRIEPRFQLGQFACLKCDLIFTTRTGTPFEPFRTEMRNWFILIYAEANWPQQVTPAIIASAIDVSRGTAGRMITAIRKAEGKRKRVMRIKRLERERQAA